MPVSEILLNLVFYLVAAAALGGAVAVAVSKNIVRSAFALLTVLFSVAAVYALVRADFIVAAQILIYVGGILVLIIFAIMLTHKITDVKLSNESSPGPVSVTACACLFALIVTAFVAGFSWERGPRILRTGEFSTANGPAIAADLSMWQGDGRTGIDGGGTILDGYVKLQLKTRSAAPGSARVQFGLAKLKVPKVKKVDSAPASGAPPAPEWVDVPAPKAVKFVVSPDGSGIATADLERLEEGLYRWKARLISDAGESNWVEFGPGQAPDFKSEKGLTRAIGRAFMGPYLLAFEIVSVLLLAALVGAAFLARKEVRE